MLQLGLVSSIGMFRVLGSEAVCSKMFMAEVVLDNKGVGEAWYESSVLMMFNTVGLRVVEPKLQLALEDDSEMMESMALGTIHFI